MKEKPINFLKDGQKAKYKKHMTKQQWDKLREKFFKECTESQVGLTKICVAPHDLFEFFKREITEMLEKQSICECNKPNFYTETFNRIKCDNCNKYRYVL